MLKLIVCTLLVVAIRGHYYMSGYGAGGHMRGNMMAYSGHIGGGQTYGRSGMHYGSRRGYGGNSGWKWLQISHPKTYTRYVRSWIQVPYNGYYNGGGHGMTGGVGAYSMGIGGHSGAGGVGAYSMGIGRGHIGIGGGRGGRGGMWRHGHGHGHSGGHGFFHGGHSGGGRGWYGGGRRHGYGYGYGHGVHGGQHYGYGHGVHGGHHYGYGHKKG